MENNKFYTTPTPEKEEHFPCKQASKQHRRQIKKIKIKIIPSTKWTQMNTNTPKEPRNSELTS